MKITKATPLKDLALYICMHLKENKIDAVLTGGAVVSIYTENKYQSYDLDFISYSSQQELIKVMKNICFTYQKNRYFTHPDTDYFVEFPPPPVSIGNKPIHNFNEIIEESGYLKLLTPTHSVMDRLASYYFWNDYQSLEQAIMICLNQNVDFGEIKEWSIEENSNKKYEEFLFLLEKKKREE